MVKLVHANNRWKKYIIHSHNLEEVLYRIKIAIKLLSRDYKAGRHGRKGEDNLKCMILKGKTYLKQQEQVV